MSNAEPMPVEVHVILYNAHDRRMPMDTAFVKEVYERTSEGVFSFLTCGREVRLAFDNAGHIHFTVTTDEGQHFVVQLGERHRA